MKEEKLLPMEQKPAATTFNTHVRGCLKRFSRDPAVKSPTEVG